jgi:hypothetical protein
MTRIAFPTDEHYPFQDEYARSIALQIVGDFRPDVVVAGSDGLDFYNISSFDKNPHRIKVGLQEEIDQWKAGQREWADASPGARRVYIPGNHEDRLRKWLWRHPEMILDATRLENVLDLKGLGIEWENTELPADLCEYVFHDRLVIRHGKYVRKNSGMSARAEAEHERFSISVLTGHSHRGGAFYARTRQGMVEAHEGFCLCRLDPEYAHFPDWSQGIVVVDVGRDFLSVESIPFHGEEKGKRAVWRGKEYRPAR